MVEGASVGIAGGTLEGMVEAYAPLVHGHGDMNFVALGSAGPHPNWSVFFPFFQGRGRTFIITERRLLVFTHARRHSWKPPGQLVYEGDPAEFFALPKKRLTRAEFGDESIWVRRTQP